MKFLIQKVKNLKIYKEKEKILDLSKENFSLLIYVAFEKEDENKKLDEIINFLEKVQILNENNKFSKSIKDLKPTIVFVSQITLSAEFEKTGRINFNQALEPSLAKNIFEELVKKFNDFGYNVYKTEFGSYLEIESINLGPINFVIEK